MAQPTDYDKRWKKVDELVQKQGLTRSAIREVESIYEQASKENNGVQKLKSLIYLTDLESQVEEAGDLLALKKLESRLEGTGYPFRQLLHSVIATRYNNYLQENRWHLYEFDPVEGGEPDEWGLEELRDTILHHYRQSLAEPARLKTISLEGYDALIRKGNARQLRPTLYDLLAHHALEYFRNDERELHRPAYAFTVDDVAAFSPAADFVKHEFVTRDSTSPYFQALLIFQDLLRMHMNDADPSAFIDADLRRLEFVEQVSVVPDKEEHLIQALGAIYKKHPSNERGLMANVTRLQKLHQSALRYDPRIGNEQLRFALVDIRKELETIVDKFPGTEANGTAQQLLDQIRTRQVYATTELVNIPGKPFLSLVSFRNVDRMYYRVIAWKEKDERDANTDEKTYWKKLASLPYLRQETQALPDPGDHREHSVEIPIGKLAAGNYALLTSSKPDFGLDDNELAVQFFHVSRISYVSRNENYFVLDRETGSALAGAEIRLMNSRYDYNTRKNSYSLAASYKTNADGYAKVPAATPSSSYTVEVVWKDERLFTRRDNHFYRYREPKAKQPQVMTALFTDRKIYRPGQIVYFKGIKISRNEDGGKTSVVQGSRELVTLFDANGQRSDSLQLETNEFGSYHGQFKLPQDLLTGNFTLRVGDGSAVDIQVEEYKRPSFEVLFDTVRAGVALGDTVTVNGSVKGYAGNGLNDVRLKYRVTRRALLPWRYSWFRSEETEITNGEMLTDGSGSFSLAFPALADQTIARSIEPAFVFEISIEATDASGETRTGQKYLTISYSSLSFALDLEDQYPADSLKKMRLRALNAEGLAVDIPVSVTIHELTAPGRLLKQRLWSAPDLAVMKREEFVAMFPFDPWLEEQDPSLWPKKSRWMHSTERTGEINFGKALPSGYYLIEVTGKDTAGRELKTSRIVRILGTEMPFDYLWTSVDRKAEVGGKANVTAWTAVKEPFMIRQVDRKTEKDDDEYQPARWTKNISSIQVPVSEADRGGMGVIHFFVMHNRVHQAVDRIEVPWTDKELDIKVETYRDKLLPGSKETWSVRIRGKKGEQVAAEYLTAMYDASLDQFLMHRWAEPSLFPIFVGSSWHGSGNFTTSQGSRYYQPRSHAAWKDVEYDSFIWQQRGDRLYELSGRVSGVLARGAKVEDMAMAQAPADEQPKAKSTSPEPGKSEQPASPELRKDLAETAFFLPDLKTDADGNVSFTFTLPESLTRWKWQMFAHTKDLAMGMAMKEIVSQKELMIQPNMPRFLRAGDRITLSARVSNLTPHEMTGMALLKLFDAESGEPADAIFQNIYPSQYFTIGAGQNGAVQFDIIVPSHYNKALRYQVLARASQHTDGEENYMPVLANRILVTESLPITVKGSGKKKFTFGSLSRSSGSTTLVHSSITVEYSTNPAWYAVLALPYLAEYPLECSEQIFNRFYANSLASMMANKSPEIKKMFNEWASGDSSVLTSQLLKNPSLRAVLIEQTPWVLEAQNEAEQRRNLALLFNLNKLADELKTNLRKLRAQQENGAFPWFKGGRDDRYITQYILTGAGKLAAMQAVPASAKLVLEEIVDEALDYADMMIRKDHEQLLRNKADTAKNQLSVIQVQYLYMRSFFKQPIPEASRKAYDYYMRQARKFWLGRSLLNQGMLALTLHRTGYKNEAAAIVRSLKENALVNEDLGMYWKNNTRGYFWYQSPIETQAMMIQVFHEITRDQDAVTRMKHWLLNQKRVQNWSTTTATADAIHALLSTGDNFLQAAPEVVISLGDMQVNSRELKQEAGTGYMMQRIDGEKVESDMGEIQVNVMNVKNVGNVKNDGLSWGAVHWQYMEDIDKVKKAGSPVQISRNFYLVTNTDKGPVLTPLKEGGALKPGDKIKVRMVLTADRDMEYMHLRDLRPSGTEPTNVISSYHWKGGLEYYESTRDAWTDFFLSWLPKGSWTFEYTLMVTHKGEFSAGLATIQSMYAPEFNAHSGGSRMSVDAK